MMPYQSASLCLTSAQLSACSTWAGIITYQRKRQYMNALEHVAPDRLQTNVLILLIANETAANRQRHGKAASNYV